MKIGMHLQVSPRNWLPFTMAAEEAGFESVWLPEHLIMPVEMSGRPGTPHEGPSPISAATPGWDPFVQMAYLGARTEKIRFGTNVFNIGLRHPFITARSLTTADLLTNGRVEFGIGASWLSEEWDAMQLPFETRGRRVDESIRIIRRLFTEEVIEHKGEFFEFQPVGFLPKPVQEHLPFLIGGDSPAALRRTAELADGWLPMAQSLETLPANMQKIRELREKYGREPDDFTVTVFGVRGQDVDTLKQYEEIGVDRVLVSPWRHPAEAVDNMKRWGEEVIPVFHA
jgi:probable F420-dependent oxidoreductase